jgi:hypothetical protein
MLCRMLSLSVRFVCISGVFGVLGWVLGRVLGWVLGWVGRFGSPRSGGLSRNLLVGPSS